jgi:lipid II:glycine glycyltransferase (peptidoglycan interpeptide bridge formation enzyme)
MQTEIVLENISLEEAKALEPESVRFLASTFWAEFKSRHGWRALFFKTNLSQAPLLCVLVRGIKGFSLAYVPMLVVPLAPFEAAAFFRALTDSLARYLPKRTLFVRFDPPLDFTSLDECALWKNSLKRAGRPFRVFCADTDVQPPDTVLLDLTLSENELLAQMKTKWRYNIGLAKKKGVTVNCFENSEALQIFDSFYTLFRETAQRDGIAVHSRAYYESLFFQADAAHNGAISAPRIRLYIAEHEGEAIAAIITLFLPREAVYLYGASANRKRSLMAPQLLQWQAITDAKKAGSAVYDFYGIPPIDDENHPMHGLYRFKTGFGGTIIHRPGSIDAPLSPVYAFYRTAENIRAFYYKRVKKLFKRKG